MSVVFNTLKRALSNGVWQYLFRLLQTSESEVDPEDEDDDDEDFTLPSTSAATRKPAKKRVSFKVISFTYMICFDFIGDIVTDQIRWKISHWMTMTSQKRVFVSKSILHFEKPYFKDQQRIWDVKAFLCAFLQANISTDIEYEEDVEEMESTGNYFEQPFYAKSYTLGSRYPD